MKNKHMILILTLMSLVSFSLYGCSSKDTSDTTQSEEQTQEIADDVETPPADEENQEYMDDSNQTPVEEIQGEGAPDREIPDLAALETAPLKEKCVITDASGAELCTLSITKAKTTDERDENNLGNPENVVVIDYTYTASTDETVLFDDMSFKLVIDDTVCTPYYAGFLTTAEPVSEGDSCSAQIAFEVASDAKEGTLVFTNMITDEELSFALEF